jgi:non-heme chloroperoxidase
VGAGRGSRDEITRGLERPILSGWSDGGVVICDDLRHYGQDAVGGIHLVNAVTRLGEPALPFLGPRFMSLVPGLCSPDVDESTARSRHS